MLGDAVEFSAEVFRGGAVDARASDDREATLYPLTDWKPLERVE